MNRKNIKKVRDVIAVLPAKRFNMDQLGPADARRLNTECGTAACIAGWTRAIFDLRTWGEEGAAVALGLSTGLAGALFYPSQLGDGLDGAWRRVKPAHAVRVLDHLLETGEVDWVSTRRAKKAVAS